MTRTTRDAFLGGRLMIAQPQSGYRAGIDAVFLAAALPVNTGRSARVLDIGAGVGTVGLCVAARCETAEVMLLEREPGLAALARENIADNSLGGRVQVAEVSLDASPNMLAAAGLTPETFDHVAANPPYHDADRGTAAADAVKAASHAMPAGDLDGWIRFMARMAKPGGTATLIHKADALAAVLAAMTGRFGAIHVHPLHPRADEPASRIIVQGVKGSRAPLVLLPGMVLHGEGSAFSARAMAVLRDGAAVVVSPLIGR